MNFTFGIVTNGNNDNYIKYIIDSIVSENIPNYEIIIVGNSKIKVNKNIEFDESMKQGWITKKKNLITKNAAYENIVFMHDYIMLMPNWYEGQLKATNNFSIRMDKILNYDGTRFRDWCVFFENNEIDYIVRPNFECLLPYTVSDLTKYQYISGSYWIAKKYVMEKYPLDESLGWGESEDVVWSKQVRQEYKFDMNTNSSVFILKEGKNRIFNLISDNKLKEIYIHDKINHI